MAKRRMTARQKRYFGKKGSYGRHGGSSSDSIKSLMLTGGCAMAYGAGRQYVEGWIKPLTDKIPFGGYADELVLGTVGAVAAVGKLPLIPNTPLTKAAGKVIFTIEAARLGSGLAAQFGGAGSNAQSGAPSFG